jgi:hypothetical protein
MALHTQPAEGAPATASEIVAAYIAQRDEYIQALRSSVQADADYFRWSGHAEARRQLSERLEKAAPEEPKANLGLASTHELIQELAARSDVAKTVGEYWPNYRTVGDDEAYERNIAEHARLREHREAKQRYEDGEEEYSDAVDHVQQVPGQLPLFE